jgi:biofilm PGA synthesis N-glycosyltransferase PgaC
MSMLLITIAVVYTMFLIFILILFLNHPSINCFELDSAKPVSIIICARNEEKTIARCLLTIIEQDYPKNLIEIVVVNDASTDNTKQIAEKILKHYAIQFQIISNQIKKGKKKSLSNAIEIAKNEIIITRDADTYTNSKIWLSNLVNFHVQKSKNFVIAPVMIADNTGLLWALQAIETNVLTVFSVAFNKINAPFLCNGANLLFTKTLFNQVNGYNNHIDLESGDDVLFLEDVKKNNLKTIGFLKSKSSIVYTYPQKTFLKLINQRCRWANKFNTNPNKINLVLGAFIFSVNAIWIFAFIQSFFVLKNQQLGLIFIFLKLIIDSLLLFLALRFVNNKNLVWYVLPIGLIYPIYVCIVSITSIIFKPKWK